MADAGFALDLLSPELSEYEAEQLLAFDQGRTARHPFTVEMVRERVASEVDLIRTWGPDVIVIGSTLTMFISARVAKVPLVYIRPYAMSRSHFAAAVTFPTVSGSGWPSRLVNRLSADVLRMLLRRLRWKPRSFSAVAAEYGLELPSLTFEALDADLNLIASPFPLLDARPLSPGDQAVGPIYAKPPAELPEEIRSLAEGNKPVVHLGLGSSASAELAEDLLDQLAAMDIHLITGAGSYLPEQKRSGLGGNVHVFDFLPAHLLAGMIDASVIHGGEGTVQAACASGVPFMGIGLQPEQRHNIDECVHFGNALAFTAADVRKGRISGLVHRVLTDAGLYESARRLQYEMAHMDGPAHAASWIVTVGRQQHSRPDTAR